MSPSGGAGPTGSLSAAITGVFGSLGQFQLRFEEAGAALFGSGWVWLVLESGKRTRVPQLEIVTTSGHDHPLQQGLCTLLVNDVWEHAYYLRYENKCLEYLKKWWSIVDWNEVARRFARADATSQEMSPDYR